MQTLPAGNYLATVDAPFVRMWRGFLTGRVMVALALLVLQGAGQIINQVADPTVLALCVAYLVATVALRVLARQGPPSPGAGPQWLPSIGLDLAAIDQVEADRVNDQLHIAALGNLILGIDAFGQAKAVLKARAAAAFDR